MTVSKIDALHALRPNAEWSLRGNGLFWADSIQTQPTESEIQAKIQELQAAEPMRQLREQRNNLLAQTDWRATIDYPKDDQAEWLTYRQSLRDITTQTPELDEQGNIVGITWPTPPESN